MLAIHIVFAYKCQYGHSTFTILQASYMGICNGGVVNGSDLQTTKRLHVTRLQLQKRETLNAFFTARTDRLPCMRAVMHMRSNFVNSR